MTRMFAYTVAMAWLWSLQNIKALQMFNTIATTSIWNMDTAFVLSSSLSVTEL